MNAKRIGLTLAALLLAFAVASLAAQPGGARADEETRPAILRFGGDVTVPAGAVEGSVLVVDGNAEILGTVENVTVIGGAARLRGGRVGHLSVVNGAAELDAASVVRGDVDLYGSTLARAPGAVVGGQVVRPDFYGIGRGLWFFGALMALGFAVLMVLSALAAAAVAPHGVRAVGASLGGEPAPTLIATAVLWVGVPLLAVLAMATVVGIPLAVGVLVFLLPALAFLGYLVTGIRLGDLVLERARGSVEAGRPYLAATVGTVLLLGLNSVPVLGGIVGPVAALVGGGALALHAWRAATARVPVESMRPLASSATTPSPAPVPAPVRAA